MCVIEQWYLVQPNGNHELQERRHPCNRPFYHQPEVRTLQDEYVVISPTARVPDPAPSLEVYEVIASNTDQGQPATTKGKKSKRNVDSFRLEFDWHIPFTSRNKEKKKNKKPSITVVRPATPPAQPKPSPVIQSQPFAFPPYPDMRPRSYGWQYPSQYPPPPPPPPQPRVIPISPRPAEPRLVESRARSHRPVTPVVTTQVHTRRSVPRSPSPRRRNSSSAPRVHARRSLQRAPSPHRHNHSQRLRQVNERLQELERDLYDARTAARRERAANIFRQTEIQHLRDTEMESERRLLELEESNTRYERGRRNRIAERGRRPAVEIHQTREGVSEDRGSRVLEQAVRDRHIREAGRGGLLTGLTRQATVDGRRGRQERHAGEEIIWDDDVGRIGRRFI